MKKLVLLLLFIPLVSFGQTPFEKGFKAVFKKGYCVETYGVTLYCIFLYLVFIKLN